MGDVVNLQQIYYIDIVKCRTKKVIMKLSPIVNVEVPMPAEMLHALNRQEAICTCKGIDAVTVESTILFLTEKYNSTFAAQFKPEYLIPKHS